MNATTVLCSLSEGRFATSLLEAQILIWNHEFLVLRKVLRSSYKQVETSGKPKMRYWKPESAGEALGPVLDQR